MINALRKTLNDHKQHVAESYIAKDDFIRESEATREFSDKRFGEVNNRLDRLLDLFIDNTKKK